MPIINQDSVYSRRAGSDPNAPIPDRCGACEEEVPPGSGQHIRTERSSFLLTVMCDSCASEYVRCEFCGRYTHEDHIHTDANIDNDESSVICEECYECFAWCDACGTNRSLDEHDFEHYDDEDPESDYGVHGYSYKPTPFFFVKHSPRVTQYGRPDDANGVFTGFELEVECARAPYGEAARTAQDIFGDVAYLKSDGSLEHGFEIVSHPMSLDFVRNGVDWGRMRELASMGVRSAQTSTCGLHVHVSRAWMRRNPTLQYRFMSLFYNNVSQWQSLAGRSQSSYAVWSDEERESMLRYAKNLKSDPDGWNSGNYNRYVALNLQGPSTIELRFFKGTLKPSTLLARIEAVHAVSNFVRESQYRLPASSVHEWARFREWTINNKYEAFNAYATEKGV